ncbi:hypothetical protein CVT24_002195 [Panaeolus cyanescens]|uniref:Calcineurin-like phosphoesterase domain-containing protein n=1 Tax=Panaeolus cyanescens TaxID=181874 RepID=A0A409YI13_9AGAR|nr:hypothetical protein CVT24_002195 [Panaeolus cyanescens]
MYTPRQIVAYGTLTAFLVLVTFNGITNTILHPNACSLQHTFETVGSFHRFMIPTARPDISHYELVEKLEAEDFPLDDESKRLIIVGDLHGMSHSFQALLKKLEYSPSEDVLVHVGDMVAKGPHKGSLAILDFMTTHNIIGVRGNHDQTVIEWRGWIEWVQTMRGGQEWLSRLDKQWEAAHRADKHLDVEDWNESQRKSCRGQDKKWWNLVPKDWIVKGDHYRIARDMTPAQYKYLLDLPLRLYIPSAHMFVMHAGMLPLDPHYSDEDKRQPLAHSPYVRDRNRDKSRAKNNTQSQPTTIDQLRNIQEIGLLTDIPQNGDPWAALNMRTIDDHGSISNKPSKGTYWTKLWKKQMNRCGGYRPDVLDMQLTESNVTWPDIVDWGHKKKKMHSLPCYPSTAVYGHTASRGLEVKRWTVGLDSGCVSLIHFTLWTIFVDPVRCRSPVPIPDFGKLEIVDTLLPAEFPIDDNSKRLIIVGDLHGMSHSFSSMLDALDYSKSKDVLMHVGDITTRGPLQGSLEILDFMSANNITGVRGNNDQKVVEWRGWLEWIHGMSGGREWLARMDREWRDIVRVEPAHDVEAWNRGKRRWSRGEDQVWWSLVPQEWIMHSSHYEVAREMAPNHFSYLLDLPIRLYVPSAHMFIMHAGMLAADPRYPSTDKTKQPLARLPITDILEPVKGPSRIHARDVISSTKKKMDPHAKAVDRLRNLQEIALLTQIPQNQIAWAALNMRRILKDGTVSRKHKKGTAWTNVWKDEMSRCGGFPSSELGLTEEQMSALNLTMPEVHGMKKTEDSLPCYPSTAIYGHAASRGLEIKRWSIGLDSGCVYGNDLTALVVGGAGVNTKQSGWRVQRRALQYLDDNDEEYFVDDEDDEFNGSHHVEYSPLFPFGDRMSARTVSMKCSISDS